MSAVKFPEQRAIWNIQIRDADSDLCRLRRAANHNAPHRHERGVRMSDV